jgi:hypothetical protein
MSLIDEVEKVTGEASQERSSLTRLREFFRRMREAGVAVRHPYSIGTPPAPNSSAQPPPGKNQIQTQVWRGRNG